MAKTDPKTVSRFKRIRRIRKKISGTGSRPRLRVFKSNKHIYAQLIDDTIGKTLVSMSTVDKEFESDTDMAKIPAAHAVGKKLAEKAIDAGMTEIVFDRGGSAYHGRVRSLAEGAREGGLRF